MSKDAAEPDRAQIGFHILAHETPPEARAPVFNDLFFNLKERWQFPFWLMLLLSCGMASLGLSENSAATVIGAMIVAPMGQPIIALGASIALGWPVQIVRMAGLVAVGALSAVATAYLFGLALPDTTPNEQVLLRTAPDVRDLGIAIFSGVAGAYGYYRKEFSTVLAGVAIAVALVPPLCTVGLMVEQGRLILASGAFLLFLANFVGIALAAVLTFFLVGTTHLGARRRWFIGGSVATGAAMLAILGPLAANYEKIAAGPRFQRTVYSAAAQVLRGAPGRPELVGLSIDGAQATLSLRPLPADADEQKRVSDALQRATGLQVVLAGADDRQ